ncbi:MAG: hypothetical protein ACTHLE_05935 [Agriterribacter sp.]
MKKIIIISTCIMILLSCNNNAENETKNTNMNDTNSSSNAAEPTPGLGQDPTRNDTRQGDPLGQSAIADSSTQKGEAEPTPGLGHDPTRTTPANAASPSSKNTGRTEDSVRRGN